MAAPSGTTWGSIVGSYGRVGIYIGISNTNTQTTVTVSTWFWSKYSCDDSNNSYYYNNNATSATTRVGSANISTSVDTGEGWSTSNQVKLAETSYTYDRGTSAVTRNCATKLTDVDRVGGEMTHTRSYTIPALESYTVSYNANGGSGAPSSQTKYYGKTLTISSTKPTRTGYTFAGWSLTKDGDVYYTSGSSCGKNEDLTLYAVWEEHYLTINYYSNYATSAFSDALNIVGADKNVKVWTVTVYYDNDYSTYGLANYSNSGGSVYMTRTGYTATGKWATSDGTLVDEDTGFATGQAMAKALGEDLSNGSKNINLYAQWDANSYTYNIVYKSSSGTQLETATVSKDYGTTNTVSPKSFTGYTSPSSQSVKWDSTSAKTITFTYTPITYNVTINCNGGSGVNSRTYNIETATFTLDTPSRTGYTFNGWTGSNGTTAQKTVSVSKGSTGDKTYTAQWDEHKLTVNYYSNKADYGTFQGNVLNVSGDTNILVHSQEYLYDNQYNNGLSDVQNTTYIYLSRTGYNSTGYWNTIDGKSVHEKTSFSTGQDLALALGKSIVNGSTSVDIYPQWTPSGVVYIDNGEKLEPYLVYIDNGSTWDLYMAYIDDGTEWIAIS